MAGRWAKLLERPLGSDAEGPCIDLGGPADGRLRFVAAGSAAEEAGLEIGDVIVSVPSTFAAWAAFFGNRPLLPIGEAETGLLDEPLMDGHLHAARHHALFGLAVR